MDIAFVIPASLAACFILIVGCTCVSSMCGACVMYISDSFVSRYGASADKDSLQISQVQSLSATGVVDTQRVPVSSVHDSFSSHNNGGLAA